jgi:hypothetical protein
MYKESIVSAHPPEEFEHDEADVLPMATLAKIIILTFVFVFLCLPAALLVLWKMTVIDEKNVDVGMADPRRLEYVQAKEHTLSTSAVGADGRVQIPISEAMGIVVQQQK